MLKSRVVDQTGEIPSHAVSEFLTKNMILIIQKPFKIAREIDATFPNCLQ